MLGRVASSWSRICIRISETSASATGRRFRTAFLCCERERQFDDAPSTGQNRACWRQGTIFTNQLSSNRDSGTGRRPSSVPDRHSRVLHRAVIGIPSRCIFNDWPVCCGNRQFSVTGWNTAAILWQKFGHRSCCFLKARTLGGRKLAATEDVKDATIVKKIAGNS